VCVACAVEISDVPGGIVQARRIRKVVWKCCYSALNTMDEMERLVGAVKRYLATGV
jgi:hypothetical protein